MALVEKWQSDRQEERQLNGLSWRGPPKKQTASQEISLEHVAVGNRPGIQLSLGRLFSKSRDSLCSELLHVG